MGDDGNDAVASRNEPEPLGGTRGPAVLRKARVLRARFPRTSAYLLRSLVLAASTIVVVSLTTVTIAGWGILNSQQRYRDSDGYRITGGEHPATWSDALGFSPAGQWYSVLGTIGGYLPGALAIMLLLVQPAMELGVRWTRSRGLGVILGLVPVAVIGLVICALIAGSLGRGDSPAWAIFWTAFGTVVFIAVAYGLPILLLTACIIGVALLAERRRLRPVILGVAAALTIAIGIGSIGLFRPPPITPVAEQPVVGEFVRTLSPLVGVTGVEVVGPAATIMLAPDAEEAEILAVARAAVEAADDQSEIVLVVLQRESGRDGAMANDPAYAPWRLQLLPSGFPTDTLPTQVSRVLGAEQLGVRMVITSERPAITVPSIAALPEVVAALGELVPDGASVDVPERFSMVYDPSQLSPAMVDAVVAVAVAYPDAEFEVTQQPKLYVNHVSPEAAAAIEAILRDPALAGSSPSGYPAEYQIRTSGPDGEAFLEGTFG